MGSERKLPTTIVFNVKGAPAGKGRPRFTRSGHTYTPKKTKDMEEVIRLNYATQCRNRMFDDMVGVCINAYLNIPKQTKKSAWECMRKLLRIFAPKKPDIDNIAKLVLDALNGVAYPDDKNIVELIVTKQYDPNRPEGHLRVAVYEVKNIGKDGEEVWKKM